MDRIIITGAIGVGKTHLARRFSSERPEVPHVSFDALMKRTTNRTQKPRSDIDTALANVIGTDAWVLDGGPRLLPMALPRAEAVIWLDPPFALRAWRSLSRPLKGWGRPRAELPDAPPDRLSEQLRFACKALSRDREYRTVIAAHLSGAQIPVLCCYNRVDVDSAFDLWAPRRCRS